MESPVQGLDIAQLKVEISKTYTAVASNPARQFSFPTGRAWAEDLDYPTELLAAVPEIACQSFAGVANPFSLGSLQPGERVLDLGSGAGMDSLVAAQMVAAEGSVTGIDMTPAMLARARQAATELGVTNTTFVEGQAEKLPFQDGSFDVVISNGVIDLIPDKDAVFSELFGVRQPRRYVRPLGIRRDESQSGEVQRPRYNRQGIQASLNKRANAGRTTLATDRVVLKRGAEMPNAPDAASSVARVRGCRAR